MQKNNHDLYRLKMKVNELSNHLDRVTFNKNKLDAGEEAKKLMNDAATLLDKVFLPQHAAVEEDEVEVTPIDHNIPIPDDEGVKLYVHQVVIGRLNELADKSYSKTAKGNISHINGRIKDNEGYTINDFLSVVENKSAQWSRDKKMNKYLRCSTLFNSSNFESYLQEGHVKGGVESYGADQHQRIAQERARRIQTTPYYG